jgi:hypothetical protein
VGTAFLRVGLSRQHLVDPKLKKPAPEADSRRRVSDGTRTRDRLDHNQELYLLSYAHREASGM